MPVTITVSEVRNAIYQAADASFRHGDGAPSTPVLGQWFHEGLRTLIGDGLRASPVARLSEIDADLELWKQSLVKEAYSGFVGPRLTQQHAALHGEVAQVLAFWKAMQAACAWLAELNWALRPERPSRRPLPPSPWQSLNEWLATEEPLCCTLREPGWTDSVRLVGVVDAVVRMKKSGTWCAIEFKLGLASPAADLAQACLYHLMLSKANAARQERGIPNTGEGDPGSLAVIRFRPERHEQLYAAAELVRTQDRLVALIGALAGVAPLQDESAPTPNFQADSAPRSRQVAADRHEGTAPTPAHRELGQGLVSTLAEYGVEVSLGEPVVAGPAFVRFPITLGRATKVNEVTRLPAELQVRLHLAAEPFIALHEGQLVIDVQRPDRQTIWFDEIRPELPLPIAKSGASIVPIGVNLCGRLVCADLAKPEHAHLLVAGTTGSGKSEWLRLAVAGLITTNTPDTLRFLIIDPKRNAFHALRKSPFLWKPLVFPDELPVAEVLAELAEEMDRRYRLFDGADSFRQLVEKASLPIPRIVCVCDEYRDLISRDRRERQQIEKQICRLGAKARAAGIHLILATQEPSRDTIRGPLDSNIPARIGLKMQRSVESRMLLNQAGAENLLGYGDLLFKDVGDPCRLQAPLLSEINRRQLFEADS